MNKSGVDFITHSIHIHLVDPDECLDPDRFFNIVILRVYLKHDASPFFLLSHFRSVCEAVM